MPMTIIGIDEVGRGPLAGPVVACAALIITPDHEALSLVKDSKKLSEKKREALFSPLSDICQHAYGSASVAEIEQLNILNATMLAMQRAATALNEALPPASEYSFLIDGTHVPASLPHPAKAIIKGDDSVLEIACASILAKVTRDRYMKDIAQKHPEYHWESNKGYGSATHVQAIKEHGLTPYHRPKFCEKILT